MSELLRKGRLSRARKDVVEFTSSIKADKKILRHVVSINKAHVVMLVEQGIINQNDGSKILGALAKLDKGIEPSPDAEDAHMAVEEQVFKDVGEDVGGNLNLAKSRNDQVATAIRMSLREEIIGLAEAVQKIQGALMQKSREHLDTIIPGYTHLQPAQPVTFAHYLIAQLDALERDLERLQEAYRRVDLCPMGAGALATTSFPIGRERVADLLGFDGILENSLDAVTARDFVLEILATLSIAAVDITRFVEDLILWSTAEFGLIELPDEFAFTSSIMPQKKNPDVLEVIRARMSLILGDFIASAATLKGLPSAYNLDYQEITPRLWSAVDSAKECWEILAKVVPNLKVNPIPPDKAALSFLTSSEFANMLVRNHKVPFRTAHRITGALTRVLIEEGKSLRDAAPELLAEVSQRTVGFPLKVKMREIDDVVEPSDFVESHKARGGPSKVEVKRMLKARRRLLALSEEWLSNKRTKLEEAEGTLNCQVKAFTDMSKEDLPNRNV